MSKVVQAIALAVAVVASPQAVGRTTLRPIDDAEFLYSYSQQVLDTSWDRLTVGRWNAWGQPDPQLEAVVYVSRDIPSGGLVALIYHARGRPLSSQLQSLDPETLKQLRSQVHLRAPGLVSSDPVLSRLDLKSVRVSDSDCPFVRTAISTFEHSLLTLDIKTDPRHHPRGEPPYFRVHVNGKIAEAEFRATKPHPAAQWADRVLEEMLACTAKSAE